MFNVASCSRNSFARSAVMRRRLTTTATVFKISQAHNEGTCKALPSTAHSSICSDACVVSSSQHHGMQLDVCAGADVGMTHVQAVTGTDMPYLAVGPSIDLRGELGGSLAALLRVVASDGAALDAELAEVTTNWRIERIGAIERCVLRLGAAELHTGVTPPRVVLQESVRLAERFGSEQSARFVNGVLDALARRMGRLR